MNGNKPILIGAIGAAVVIGGVAIGLILSRTPQKADLSTLHTEAAASTEAPETTAAAQTAPKETTPKDAGTASSVTADLETYTDGSLSVQYPVVSNMEDTEKQAQVNDLLKSNALSVIQANELTAEDSLTVKCQVVSVDRKRLTALYTGSMTANGAAHPISLFYTNTVNLPQVQNIGLSDYTDAYTMAGYALSDDVEFSGVSADMAAQIREYLASSMDLDILTAVLDSADFPLAKEAAWPESFSYEKQGAITFSLPLPHAMGDYCLVTFHPSTK